jgi:photosystem I reaction center subunit VIII
MTLAFAASYLPSICVPAVCLVGLAVSMALFFVYVESEA